MGLLLGLAPFILFSLLTELSVSLALWVAFASAFAIGIRDFLHAKTLRMIDGGTLVLFALLSIYVGFFAPGLTVQAVRMIASAGMLLIALASLARRQPFTLDYARDEMPEEHWDTPAFLRANYVLTTVWALAFAAMTAADAYATFNRKFPVLLAAASGLVAMALAIVFTVRNPATSRLFVSRQR